MPTEADLVQQYAVSRTTARRALNDLRHEGLVVRQPGKGTFVLPPQLAAAVPHLQTITEQIRHLGYEPGVLGATAVLCPANPAEATQLGVEAGAELLAIHRVRTADGQPVYVATSYLNLVDFPQLRRIDIEAESLLAAIEELTGQQIDRTVQWLSAEGAPGDVARHLGLSAEAPVLRLHRVVYLDDGRPVDVVRGYFHGAIYRHYSEARRRYPT